MPGWLQDTFFSDYAAELTMVLIGLGVLLLIIAALRRRSRGRDERVAEAAQRPRIAVLEWAVVDEKRRLVLIQRDEATHLVMIGGPTDVVIEGNIGLPGRAPAHLPASQAGFGAARSLAAASIPMAVEPVRVEPAPARSAPQPAAPASEALEPAALSENHQAEPPAGPHAEHGAATVPPIADSAPAKPAPKPRPPLAAVPAVAAPQGNNPRNAPGPTAPESPGPKRAVASAGEPLRSALAGEVRPGGNGRLTPARKEPSLGAGGTSRWAGPGQSAQLTVGEPANTQDRAARDTGMRTQAGPIAPAPANTSAEAGDWTEGDDIEGEIVRALRTDPFPPLTFPAGSSTATRSEPTVPELRIAGTATASPGTTLGDLAEKLEEALAREVRSASQGRTRLDLDLDAFTAEGRAPEPPARPSLPVHAALGEAGPNGAGGALHRGPAVTSPVAPARQAHLSAAPAPEVRREPQAAIDQQDDPPVISLSARRREVGDPLEDEMARLLGELTDGARR